MTIYRIENAEGIGPYQSARLAEQVSRDLDRMYVRHVGGSHPSPPADKKINRIMRSTEFCGFDTIEALETWFSGHLFDLLCLDFKVMQYTIDNDHVTIGEKQCLFIRCLAREKTDITDRFITQLNAA